MTDHRGYNTFGELTSYTASVNSAPALTDTYTLDAIGRIAQKIETIGGTTDTFTYGYDPAGRLQTVTQNGTEIAHYDDDANSNRLTRTTPGGTVSGTYDAQDRLLSYGAATYTYTPNGELLTKTVGGQTMTYTYDPLGNLRAVQLPDGTLLEYVIDGASRRIGKKVNGVLVQGFVYEDQLRVAAELDGSGNVVARFVYGTHVNVPDYMVRGGATYRLVTDHLGSPRLVLNTADGSVAQRMDYDEFGRVLVQTCPSLSLEDCKRLHPFGFAGGPYDPDTGLVRFGARDYDAATGRWTAKDAIRFAGGNANLYGYALGDPVNVVDAEGHFAQILGGAIGGALGGLASRRRSECCDHDGHHGRQPIRHRGSGRNRSSNRRSRRIRGGRSGSGRLT